MKIINWIENHFGAFLMGGIIAGMLFPEMGHWTLKAILPIMGIVLLLTFLKVNFSEILNHLKNIRFLGYVTTMYMLIIPGIVFAIFQNVNPDLAVAALLLSAVPCGVSAAPLTHLLKGNTSLSITLTILSYLIAPITLPLLFKILVGQSIDLDIVGLFKTLLFLIFIPLGLSEILKKYSPKNVKKIKPYTKSLSVLIISVMVYTGIAIQRDQILENPEQILNQLAWLYGLFLLYHTVGYLMAPQRPKTDKIAISVSKTYMNNTLGIALAVNFFNPAVVLFMVLSEIPWSTAIIGFKIILKYLK
ncbi:MAG: hypothetical protein ACD_28C00075G0002 [uncultured bacterium]|nr:MAG: hypothetical protein ACD_28C00075G0002 [uncultured bacterium]KKT72648.1 MAG: Bile acid:sodium symporter family protein [Candidatus Peregrinibacteria bacterium GW2011_GWA2_44_7]